MSPTSSCVGFTAGWSSAITPTTTAVRLSRLRALRRSRTRTTRSRTTGRRRKRHSRPTGQPGPQQLLVPPALLERSTARGTRTSRIGLRRSSMRWQRCARRSSGGRKSRRGRPASGPGGLPRTSRRRPVPTRRSAGGRPLEELDAATTDDSSFTKIMPDDAADELGERIGKSDAKRQFSRRLSDLFGRDG